MSKNKLEKFAEMATFSNVFQPAGNELTDFKFKNKWNEYFGNSNPIYLELGCGKGEYTIALAKKYPNINVIGVDIKGARIWRGAKTANEENLQNICFIRTKIENIGLFFGSDEISEILVPFPDPQPKKPKRRLTSFYFLSIYQKILKNDGIVHLKTDSLELHNYTKALLEKNKIEPIECYSDVYSENIDSLLTQIQTFYEKMFLEENKKITYIKFRLNKEMNILAPDFVEITGYKY